MARLEDLERGAIIHGVLPDTAVGVIDVKWYGSDTVELTYKRPDRQPDNTLLYRDDEPRLSVATTGRPWSFDGDGHLYYLAAEAYRIHLAHLFDPHLAVHTSLVDPLPHRLTAAYGEMLLCS